MRWVTLFLEHKKAPEAGYGYSVARTRLRPVPVLQVGIVQTSAFLLSSSMSRSLGKAVPCVVQEFHRIVSVV